MKNPSIGEALKHLQGLGNRTGVGHPTFVGTSEIERILLAAYRKHAADGSSKISNRFDLIMKRDQECPPSVFIQAVIWTKKLNQGSLLQHLIGYEFFYKHEYQVSPAVLIPRPETEILVETAIREIEASQIIPKLGFEIGLGSGIISIELMSHFAHLNMLATEPSVDAVQVAKSNARKILQKDERLEIIQLKDRSIVGEVFEKKPKADFLISNPPYLATPQEADADVVRNEPHLALFAPQEDPLYFYRKIAIGASHWIRADGIVFLEIPHERSSQIKEVFEANAWSVKVIQDLNQRDRVLVAKIQA